MGKVQGHVMQHEFHHIPPFFSGKIIISQKFCVYIYISL